MKNKKSKAVLVTVCLVIAASIVTYPVHAHASDGEEYITITVDAEDDSNMKYALDSDEPEAFGDSNEFRVSAGTSHTIYVKDEAGNITSQQYEPEDESFEADIMEADEDTRKINIDLELGSKEAENDVYDFPEDSAEPGSASVSSKIKTDGSDDAEKVFYTFTTKEGETLYLVIDQGQGTDNVYLLDTVSLTDLHVLADGQTSSYDSEKGEGEDNLLSILNDNDADAAIAQTEKTKSKSSSGGNGIIILILAAIGGGAYYYLKIYRKKKDEAMDVMDAMDLDEFEPEEEEEEIEFDYDDAEKERYLKELISGEESFYNADPDDYATSHSDDEYDEGVELDFDMDSESDRDDMEEEEEE